jgi:hypothetical protein
LGHVWLDANRLNLNQFVFKIEARSIRCELRFDVRAGDPTAGQVRSEKIPYMASQFNAAKA